MITEKKIQELVEEKIAGSDTYIVEIRVRPGNKINILLDNDNNISINDCIEVSRYVEHQLDRETEDFELEVSSPGLDQPLKILRQYRKYLGKQVEILTSEGTKIAGELKAASEDGIVVETRAKERVEGKKSKQLIVREHKLPLGQVKETKIVISFK